MGHGDLIWADLSTFDRTKADAFYTRAFGWRISSDDYGIASTANGEAAGIYLMPEKFVNIGMPSFWMSYIEVSSADDAAAKATTLGGKVEVGPVDEPGAGRIALIRDPLGAGFTVVEAPTFKGTQTGPGARSAHALFVSDASAVMPFYAGLFGWRYEPRSMGQWAIYGQDHRLAELHQISDPALRGKEEYWCVAFNASSESVYAAGASKLGQVNTQVGAAQLWRDDQGAAFLTTYTAPIAETSPTRRLPLFALIGLALTFLSLATGWTFVWAIFFAVWIYVGLRDRATYLLEMVIRDDHPAVYWIIMALYAALGIFALFGEV